MERVIDYTILAKLYVELESTTKRLEKTNIVATALKDLSSEEIRRVIYLLQGTVFPPWSSQKVGVAERLVIRALQLSFGESEQIIENLWKLGGDLGGVAEELAVKKKQTTLSSMRLSIQKVFENIEKLSSLEGAGTIDRKVQLIAELLTSSTPREARYIVRTLLGQLRAGLGEGTIRDAIIWAFVISVPFMREEGFIAFSEGDRKNYNEISDKVQQAIDLTCDAADVAELVKGNGIDGIKLVSLFPGRPLKVMLFQKASGIGEAFERVGKPAYFEYKYDGFRMQIHKMNSSVKIFTRRLEEVTAQFPDVISLVSSTIKAESCILDAEAVGLDCKSWDYLPFQHISQRIKRKYGVEEMAFRFPVEIRVFDVVWVNGVSYLNEPYEKRRKMVEAIIPSIPHKMGPAEILCTQLEEEAVSFYQQALAKGMEGVMAKSMASPYQPGSRVGFGVKIKPVMDTLDLVVVASEWGEGKRTGWLTSFTLACKDKEGAFLEVGNVGTGFKEKDEEGTSFSQMTKLLKPYILEEHGRSVRLKAQIVLEIKFEEVQESPTYASGFALRFPRLVQVREDKSPDDTSTIEDIKSLFSHQHHR